MNLILNWFRFELSTEQLRLPVCTFENFPASTNALRNELKSFDAYRPRSLTKQQGDNFDPVQVILFDGPSPPTDFNYSDFLVRSNPGLVSRIVKHSLVRHWRERDALAEETNFGVNLLWLQETFPFGVRILTGVSGRVHQPMVNGPYGLVLSWKVRAEFTESLANSALRKHCTGLPVIFRPNHSRHEIPPALWKRRSRYIGHVAECVSDSKIRIAAYDHSTYVIPSAEAYIEASSATLSTLDERCGGEPSFRSVVRRIQELSYAMTAARRRSTSVFKDRLAAIRRFVSPEGKETLTIPLVVYGGGAIFVDLMPLELQEAQAQ